MYLSSNLPEECYGCRACFNACHRKAISFQEADDTFLYPVIDKDKCVECGECRRVCPIQYEGLVRPQQCIVAIAKDRDDWERSSSGGAFKVLALAAWERCRHEHKQFYLCACDWDASFSVLHKIVLVEDVSHIEQFCKSKYVQSDTHEVYKTIKTLLANKDNNFIFVGTPCQVAGLKMFLRGVEENNLICIDLICHGVPSQAIFDKYRADIENQEGSELACYTFKNKHMLENGTIYTRSARIEFKNGYTRMVTRFSDDYINLFYTASYHNRPSCYTCHFKNSARVGDITIGDAWHIDQKYPELNPMHGISLILFNTDKAKEYVPYIHQSMKTYDCDYDFMIESNDALQRPRGNPIPKEILNKFFAEIKDDRIPFSESAKTYIKAITEYKTK